MVLLLSDRLVRFNTKQKSEYVDEKILVPLYVSFKFKLN